MSDYLEMPLDYFTTISEAKSWLQRNVDVGCICPACGRKNKVYRRTINQGAVQDVCSLYRLTLRTGEAFHHYSKFTKKSTRSDFEKTVFLGLIERAPLEEGAATKTSGVYAVTPKGAAFCRAEIAIPSHIIVYHNQMIGVGQELKGVREMWPEFNYIDLMNGV
jgi:hypothetical protein